MDSKTILAADSTATVAAVAVRQGGKTLASLIENSGSTHSVMLLPMIEKALSDCGLTLDDIDVFAISQGPGSFTGVRIGAAVIKGLAFKSEKPCVGVSTLDALAYNLKGYKGIICPCMNARRDQVYTAIFRGDGKNIARLTEDMAISVAELSEKLSGYGEEVYFCGDGYSLVESLTGNVTPDKLRWQNAASVAAVAEKVYDEAEDKTFHPDVLVPTYLRKPQAEREREERLKENNDN